MYIQNKEKFMLSLFHRDKKKCNIYYTLCINCCLLQKIINLIHQIKLLDKIFIQYLIISKLNCK